MKIEFIKTNIGGKHDYQIQVDGEVIKLDNNWSRKITNTGSNTNDGIFSNQNKVTFWVNHESEEFFIPTVKNYNLDNGEFQKWIEIVKEVRDWADSIHSKNETVIFTANI
jgi:hypothetical protein